MAFPAGLSIRTTGLPMTAVPLAFRPARSKSWSPLALRTSLCRRNICHAAATYTSNHKLIKYLTFDELDSAFPFVLQLPQSQTERMVTRYLARLGTEVERRVELVGFEKHEDGVRAMLQLTDC